MPIATRAKNENGTNDQHLRFTTPICANEGPNAKSVHPLNSLNFQVLRLTVKPSRAAVGTRSMGHCLRKALPVFVELVNLSLNARKFLTLRNQLRNFSCFIQLLTLILQTFGLFFELLNLFGHLVELVV